MTNTTFKVGQVVRFVDANDAGCSGARRGELYKITKAPADGVETHTARHADGTYIDVYGDRFEAVTDFQAGDEVQVVKSGAHYFWYSDRIGQTFKLNSHSRRMLDGVNYGTDHDGHVIAGCDIILVARPTTSLPPFIDDTQKPDQQEALTMDFTNIENRTIAQIKAKLDELNTTIASAQAEIKIVEDERDGLIAQLKAVGIVVSGTEGPVRNTMKDAYNQGLIRAGDSLRSLVSQGNYTKDVDYRVRRVDSDGSVLVDDDNDSSDYIWEEYQHSEQFHHIPA
jgi:hypothetical protein